MIYSKSHIDVLKISTHFLRYKLISCVLPMIKKKKRPSHVVFLSSFNPRFHTKGMPRNSSKQPAVDGRMGGCPADETKEYSCNMQYIDLGVSKNNGTPKSSILIGFSIIFTIHLGGGSPYFWKHPSMFSPNPDHEKPK